jgi:hypothetical protein
MKKRIAKNEEDISDLQKRNIFIPANEKGDGKGDSLNNNQLNMIGGQFNDLLDKINILTQKLNHNID